METSELYLKLAQISLFTGMSLDELQRIMGRTKIDFQKFSEGDVIVRQGDKCGRLMLLFSGSISCHSAADNGSIAVTETVEAPQALQTDALFGVFQRFTHTMTALTPVSVISIGKGELLKLLSYSSIFRLNLVNSLSTALQKKENDTWRSQQGDLSSRVVNFLRCHCLSPSGHKTFYIKMRVLAEELNDNRLNISRALNALQARGLLELYRGRIEVPAMQHLLA